MNRSLFFPGRVPSVYFRGNHCFFSTFRSHFDKTVSPNIVDELESMSIINPSEIQLLSIEPILLGKNVIFTSPTGSGKTFAYLVPLIELLRRESGNDKLLPNRPSILVVVPSRELCLQVISQAKKLAKSVGKMRVEALIGGNMARKRVKRDVLNECVNLIVCTPGVFLKMRDQKKIFISNVRRIVFDEADTLFGKGFKEDMEQLVGPILYRAEKDGEKRQFVAVGATMPAIIQKRIEGICKIKKNRLVISAKDTHSVPKSLKEHWIRVPGQDKMPFLENALGVCKWQKCLVFVKDPNCARAVDYYLNEKGHKNVFSLHRDIPSKMREDVLKRFVDGKESSILVCTDVASRGLDLNGLDLVVNYDIPQIQDYIHRAGRTARMGKTGHCVSLYQTKQEKAIALTIQELQGRKQSLLSGIEGMKREFKKDVVAKPEAQKTATTVKMKH